MSENEIKNQRNAAEEISNLISGMPETECKNILNIIIGYKLALDTTTANRTA